MADYYRGEISIPTRFITAEVALWIKEEIGESVFEKREEYDGVATFTDYSALNGQFEVLEDKLEKSNVPFDRYSEGFCENMPEKKVFRPGVINTTVLLTNQDEHYVSTDNLRELLTLTPDEAYLQLAKLIAAAEPQVTSLEEIAKEYTCSQCEKSLM